MRLIDILATGFPDCPSGSATIYKRGTTQAATVWSNFQGTNQVTTHTLDARGRVTRYCNEYVDVTVYDSTGAYVAGPFTVAGQFSNTEIIHAHWTGTDYDTAQSALNKPLTAQSFLDKLYASFGADDGKVLVGGVQQLLKNVLLTGIIDVKGPTYGAKGDGVTDDTVPIQTAINAANSAGGGILFFPPGTYKVSSLTIPTNVSMLGAGSGKSILSTSSAASTLLSAAGGFIATALGFSTTGKGLISFTAPISTSCEFVSCAFTSTSAATANAIDFGGANTSGLSGTFLGCDFTQTGTAATKGLFANGVYVIGGEVSFVSGTLVDGGRYNFTDVVITFSGATTQNVLGNASPSGTFVGCQIQASNGAGTLNLNLTQGNFEVGGQSLGPGTVVATDLRGFFSQREWFASDQGSGSAASYTPDARANSKHFIISSNAGFTFNTPTFVSGGAGSGTRLELWYKNTSGGPVTPAFGAGYKVLSAAVAPGSAIGFIFSWSSTLAVWVQMGGASVYAS